MGNLFLLVSLLPFVLFIQHQTIFANDEKHIGLSFRMIYRDSPESPLYQPNLTREERMERLIRMSDARLQSLTNLNRNNSVRSSYLQTIQPPIQEYGALYIVEVGFGTFKRVIRKLDPYNKYYLMLDTGSDVVWTACEGCYRCLRQEDLYFPRSRSQTYKPFPCDQCPPDTICQQDHCTIERVYGDGTHVQGIAARETFTFKSSNNEIVSIPNIVFTCAMRIQNFVPGMRPFNVVSGIFGMNRGEFSFAKQIEPQIGGRFSYCLQPHDSQRRRSPMLLRFGADIPLFATMHSTPMIMEGHNPLYHLHLTGLSVSSRRLSINPSLFRTRQDGSGGCFIDSSTTTSYIVNEAYAIFEDALTQHIKSHNPNLRKVASPWEIYRLCYERFEEGGQRLPSVTFHFANNADFVIQPEQYMPTYLYHSNELYCLAIRPSPGVTVLGAKQQVNHRIVYDTINSLLLFAPCDCSVDN